MRELLASTPVMPIISISERETAVDVARALVAGGVRTFEVLLRTPQALDAITDMRKHVPEATVGAGTLLTAQDVRRAVDAGAQFGVTPGLTDELAQAIAGHQLPALPGVWTASEVMKAMAFGFQTVKLFPANALQGVAQIEQLQSVFPTVRFCPTGGIKPEHIPTYLNLPGCLTVGGSWVTPRQMIAARDFAGITALAKQASSYRR